MKAEKEKKTMDMKTLEMFKQSMNKYAERITAAQYDYMLCKVEEDTIKEISENIQQEILNNGNYLVCDEIWNDKAHRRELTNRKITKPFDTYLMDETIFINDFLEKCYAEYVRQGIAHPKGKEYIPEADAKDNRIKAENVLLQLVIDSLPDILTNEKATLKSACKHWKYRDELLKLAMSLKAE